MFDYILSHSQRIVMNNLTKLISDLGIIVEVSKSLPSKIKGFYYQDSFYNILVINSRIKTERDLRQVLSHELGHYFTSIANNSALSYSHYSNIINSHRNEIRAIRWACDYLIPTDVLLDVINNNVCISKSDLLEYFEIDESLLIMKYYFMSTHKSIWKIGTKRRLVLSSLPSVYIYDEF